MKHLQRYENYENSIGKFVVLKPININRNDQFYSNYENVENSIGQIIYISKKTGKFGVRINDRFFEVYENSIEYISSKKEDVELYLTAKNYNL